MSIYHTEKSLAYRKRLMHFMETEIYPREKEVADFSVRLWKIFGRSNKCRVRYSSGRDGESTLGIRGLQL